MTAQTTAESKDASEVRTIPLSEIYESDQNRRRHYDASKLKELAASIATTGQLTPCLVRLRANGKGGNFELAAGHRRRRAAELAGLKTLLCMVREMPDEDFLQVLIAENLQREDLHPLDEAEGFHALLALPGFDQGTVAARVGKAPAYVAQRLHLTNLSPRAQRDFLADKLTIGAALLLSRLQGADQDRAIHESGHQHGDGMSVAWLRNWVRSNVLSDLAEAPFPIGDAELDPKAGSCLACAKRTGAQGELLVQLTVESPGGKKRRGKATGGQPDRCLDRECWGRKAALELDRRFTDLQGQHPGAIQISTTYSARKGVLSSEKYWGAKKGETGAVAALVVEGWHDVGSVRWVTLTRPKLPGYAGASPQERKAQEKRKTEAARRRAIFEAVVPALPKHLDAAALRLIVDGYLHEMTSDSWRMLAGVLGLTPEKGRHGGRDYVKPIRDAIAGFGEGELAKFLQQLPLASELVVYSYGGNAASRLLAAAKHLDIDVDAIDARLRAEGAAKRAARARKSKPGKKKEQAAAKVAGKMAPGGKKRAAGNGGAKKFSAKASKARPRKKKLAGDVRRERAKKAAVSESGRASA